MSLHTRLSRLEQRCTRTGGACPHCPFPELVAYWQADPAAEPVMVGGHTLPRACPHCGRQPQGIELLEVVGDSREDLDRRLEGQGDG